MSVQEELYIIDGIKTNVKYCCRCVLRVERTQSNGHVAGKAVFESRIATTKQSEQKKSRA